MDKELTEQIKLCRIASQPSMSVMATQPLVVTHSLITLKRLILTLESCTVCPGNSDAHFVKMGNSHKGKLVTSNGEV